MALLTHLLAFAAMVLAASPAARVDGLKRAHVNGVELHYTDSGKGKPIVFVHGALMDYREWEPVADELAARNRTIRYSRRYNHPNDNPLRADHSALVEVSANGRR